MKIIQAIPYADGPKNLLDLYLPQTEKFDTVVYFHGGGFVEGRRDGENMIGIAKAFAAAGYGFASADYSLYPREGKGDVAFPDYIRDAARAVAFVSRTIRTHGGSGRIYVGGQSAGAYLSLMLCFAREYLAAEGVSPDEIAGWLIESGQPTSHFNILAKETGADPRSQRIDRFAPLYYLDGKTSFSRMLLLWYDDDMACRAEQNQLLTAAIRQFLPEAKITTKILHGTHCTASLVPDKDGRYPLADVAIDWLSEA